MQYYVPCGFSFFILFSAVTANLKTHNFRVLFLKLPEMAITYLGLFVLAFVFCRQNI